VAQKVNGKAVNVADCILPSSRRPVETAAVWRSWEAWATGLMIPARMQPFRLFHKQDQPLLPLLALTLASSSWRAKSPCWTPVVERTTTLPKRGWQAQCRTTRTKAALLEGSAAVNAFAGVLKVNSEYHFRRIAHVWMDPLPDRTGAHQL